MLKEKRQIFEFLFVAADLFVVSIAWLLAYWLRFTFDWIPADKGVPDFRNYFSMLLFIWLIWAFIFKRVGLYRPMRGLKRSREFWLLLQGNILAVLVLIAVTYLFREKSVPFSRLVFVYFGFLSIALLILERAGLRFFLREVRRRGYNLRYMLVVGYGSLAKEMVSRIRANKELGIQHIGCLSKDGFADSNESGVIGSYGDLKKVLTTFDVDQLVIALPLEDNQYLPDIMLQIGDSLVDVKIVPDLSQFVSVGGAVEQFEGLPVISVQASPLDEVSLFLKRVFDLLVGSFLLLVSLPAWIVIAVLTRLSSPGPIFYSQERVSFDGTKFKILKFRTMRTDAEHQGPGWTTQGDARVTGLGKFLRAYSLDELPQLLNVIKGEMSIVGPRPERPVFIEEFRRRVPRYMLRHKVPAGMTGWAQVHGWRGDTSIDKRIECDLYYIENWSLGLDFKIILMTLFRGIWSKNAC
jgi:Undecaprenyl-phosphate glucose phosphotransferase